jgi:hypothetical protein
VRLAEMPGSILAASKSGDSLSWRRLRRNAKSLHPIQ